MAYKIQGLDSDSFVSAKQKAEGKNSSSSQGNSGGKKQNGALIGVLSSNLDELQHHLDSTRQDTQLKVKSGQNQVSSQTLQDILAEIAALTNKLQEYESKFQEAKNGISTKIGKAAISAAIAAAKKLEHELHEAAKKKREMKWLGIFADVIEGIIFAIAAITGQVEMCIAMMVLFAASESGGTKAFTQALAKGLEKLGCGKKVANILASAITIIAEVVVTLGVAGVGSAVQGAAQGAKVATEAAVKEVVETAVKDAVQSAVKDAVSSALEDGVKVGSKAMETVVQDAASGAAEDIATSLADDGLGSRLVNKALEKGIRKGIEAGVKDGAKAAIDNGVDVSTSVAKSVGKKLAKSIAKTVAKEVAENMGEVATKAVDELPAKLQADLKVAAKKIAKGRLLSAVKMTAAGGVSNSGLAENLALSFSTLFPKKDQQLVQLLMTIILSLLAMVATIEAGTSMSGESNSGNALEGGAHSAEEAGSKVSKMIKGVMSKIVNNPARMMSYSQTGAGLGQAATEVAMAAAQIKISQIEDAMAEAQPDMQENNAIAKIQDQIQAEDNKLFNQLYKAIPTILADANSIGAIFASAAQALAS